PHDYYQLIIAPFLAIVSGNGARWLLHRGLTASRAAFLALSVVVLAAAPFHYLVWRKQPRLWPPLVRLQKYCEGRFKPNSSAMFFTTVEATRLGKNFHLPEYLYALRLWGVARVAPDAATARAWFEELSPTFPRLDYVIFHGLEFPDWMPPTFRLTMRDDAERFYVFEPQDSPKEGTSR
ncbi:MAG: hypothetical protein N3I86_04495, partial [Verrucomicrobiae bacterium]|nr:hypothetical protein [Verrucomicrobiae bacterium]